MSARISGLVWELQLPREEKYVLLCLADHAKNDGSDVYPSIGLIAWKTNYSERRVQQIMRSLEGRGLLVRQKEQFGRSRTIIYRINLAAGVQRPRLRRAEISRVGNPDPDTQGEISAREKGAMKYKKGEVAAAPESFEPKTLKQIPRYHPTGGLTPRQLATLCKEISLIYKAHQGATWRTNFDDEALQIACVRHMIPLDLAREALTRSYGDKETDSSN